MIRTSGLTKRYGKQTVVDSIDLDVRPGDRYGFLGPNGSGKSTTVRMLLGLVFPTGGDVEVLGEPMPKAGRRVLPQVGALDRVPGVLQASVRPGEPALHRRGRSGRIAPDPQERASTRRWNGSASPRSTSGR